MGRGIARLGRQPRRTASTKASATCSLKSSGASGHYHTPSLPSDFTISHFYDELIKPAQPSAMPYAFSRGFLLLMVSFISFISAARRHYTCSALDDAATASSLVTSLRPAAIEDAADADASRISRDGSRTMILRYAFRWACVTQLLARRSRAQALPAARFAIGPAQAFSPTSPLHQLR